VNLKAFLQSYFSKIGIGILLLLSLFLAACEGEVAQDSGDNMGGDTAVSTNTPLPTALSLPPRPTSAPEIPQPVDLTATAETPSSIRELTILYTNDEHGWMEGVSPEQSAAHLMSSWRNDAGYSEEGAFIILSGGDMWTGPAISTWFEGESMVDVMNSMGYAAAAVGNHEFDFGLDVLLLRSEQATFPFLSANIRYKSDGSVPEDVGIRPYTITTINDISVGIIGLTTLRTPTTTNPTNIAAFEFIDYETALQEFVPQVIAEGVELILVPGHVCRNELRQLANDIADLGVHLLGGGHCNELFAEERNGIVLIEGGDSMASYAQVTFQFDVATDTVVDVSYGIQENGGGTADPVVAEIIAEWQTMTNDELNVIIGYSENGLARRSSSMQALITEAWLRAYPAGDVAITNLGGMRADLAAGEITLADIITLMPFNNVIIDVTVTGEQLIEVLARSGDAAIGGAHLAGANWIVHKNDSPIDPQGSYHVLVNDFMYAGGDDFTFLAEFDPAAYDTAVDWRQPVIDWIIEQSSTVDNPLDGAIRSIDE
jgi:5'-nucleotidase / UDP-sugar diphosphatase